MSYRNKKLLKAAEGRACVLCGGVGTTVACHLRSVEFGSGTGIKCPDCFVAYCCRRCHDLIDGRAGNLPQYERQDMWTRAYLRTVQLWFDEGIVAVK